MQLHHHAWAVIISFCWHKERIQLSKLCKAARDGSRSAVSYNGVLDFHGNLHPSRGFNLAQWKVQPSAFIANDFPSAMDFAELKLGGLQSIKRICLTVPGAPNEAAQEIISGLILSKMVDVRTSREMTICYSNPQCNAIIDLPRCGLTALRIQGAKVQLPWGGTPGRCRFLPPLEVLRLESASTDLMYGDFFNLLEKVMPTLRELGLPLFTSALYDVVHNTVGHKCTFYDKVNTELELEEADKLEILWTRGLSPIAVHKDSGTFLPANLKRVFVWQDGIEPNSTWKPLTMVRLDGTNVRCRAKQMPLVEALEDEKQCRAAKRDTFCVIYIQ